MSLTENDIELARRYIICRSAIKALNLDKVKFDDPKLELRAFYQSMIEDALVRATNELRELNRYGLGVAVTDQATIYEVKIGNRHGYMEINVVEIREGIEKFFLN